METGIIIGTLKSLEKIIEEARESGIGKKTEEIDEAEANEEKEEAGVVTVTEEEKDLHQRPFLNLKLSFSTQKKTSIIKSSQRNPQP